MAESENISVGTVEYGKDKIAILKTGKYIDLHTADRRFENDLKITITAKVFDGSVLVEGEPNAPGEDIGIVLQEKIITENGEYAPDIGYDGFSKVIINIPIPEDSALPIEVKTEAEMAALLDTSEVGSVYKYTGETTDTYENDGLYIVSEE